MSYLRYGYPLKYFKGFSDSYVYLHNDGYIEDHNDKYQDTVSFADLMGVIILRETGDKKYAWKMVKILAKKLGIEDKLRDEPLNENTFFVEMSKLYGNK